MPNLASHSRARRSASARPAPRERGAERDVVGGAQVGEQGLVLEDEAHVAVPDQQRWIRSRTLRARLHRPGALLRSRRPRAAAWSCPAPLGPITATMSPGSAVNAARSRPVTSTSTRRAPCSPVPVAHGVTSQRSRSGGQDRDRREQQDHAQGAGELRLRLQHLEDQRRHRLRGARVVAGEGDGRPELAQRPGPGQDRAGEHPGQGQRQRHPPEGGPPVGAERGRHDVVPLAGRAQGALDAEHVERQRDERVGEHHRRRRVRDA